MAKASGGQHSPWSDPNFATQSYDAARSVAAIDLLLDTAASCLGASGMELRIDALCRRSPDGEAAAPLATHHIVAAPLTDADGNAGVLRAYFQSPLDREEERRVCGVERFANLIQQQLDTYVERMATRSLMERLLDAESELAATLVRLENSNRDLEQFAYIASHELLHPLRVVTVYADLLPELLAGGDPDALDTVVRRISAGTHSMQDQVSSLLTLSTIGSEQPHTLPLVHVGEVASTACNNLAGQIEDVGATVEIGSLPLVRANPVHLQSVFHNLIGNSIAYRDEKRLLHVSIAEVEQAPDSAWAVVEVADNGIGVTATDQARIFGMFERGNSNTAGFGVGLALSRRIIEHIGGAISLDSVPGEGSVFRLQLPAVAASV